MSSAVRFAAMMPARRATPRTSPLAAVPAVDQGEGGRRHGDGAAGDGAARGGGLVRDVDHAGGAARVEVGERRPHSACGCPGAAQQLAGGEPRRSPRASASRRSGSSAPRSGRSARGPGGWRGRTPRRSCGRRARRGRGAWSCSRSVSKVARSRLLMPISGDFSSLARSISSAVWTSISDVHAPGVGGRLELGGLGVGDAGEDDEDAVGAERAGLRRPARGRRGSPCAAPAARRRAGEAEVAVVALEGRRVGQHAEAGGAAVCVGLGQRGGVEVGADQALGRARLLDLGDQAVAAGRGLAERAEEVPRPVGVAGGGLDVGERARGLAPATSASL